MKSILSWVFTPPFLLVFLLVLVGMHPVLMLAYLAGPSVFRHAMSLLNWLVLLALRVAGTRFSVEFKSTLPAKGPIIIVSNHQSMFDIPLFYWYLRALQPAFIAKKELGKGFPSISFALRNTCSVLIDRKNPATAVPMIKSTGAIAEKEQFAIVIFPEGTRARDGMLKKFKVTGFAALLESMPSAKILPVAVESSWVIVKDNFMPVPFGTRVKFTVFEAMERGNRTAAAILEEIEAKIRGSLGQGTAESAPPRQAVSSGA